jgi:hypothetical protein
MRVDKFGQLILNDNDLLEILYKNPKKRFEKVLSENSIVFPDILELEYIPDIKQYQELNISVIDFDIQNQNNYFMPDEYKNIDIAKHVLDLCVTDVELQRVGTELLLYQERNMFNILKYLKYLVDTLKSNNIVFGVGRGSSVSSYVLYLLGVHKINSLYYDLDITEFLK